MSARFESSLSQRLEPVLGAVRASAIPGHGHGLVARDETPPPRPFVTISRQAGAGGSTIAQLLVDRLNARAGDAPPAAAQAAPTWTCWDRALVEKVAADHHLSERVIETLEDSHPSWLTDLFAGMSLSGTEDEARAYHYVAATIQALACAGNVVIVGRGAVFVTRRLEGGVHIRLIAPFDHRVETMAKRLNLPRNQAAEHVRRIDEARAAFYRFRWARHTLAPETFTLTVNTAVIPPEVAVECIRPLLNKVTRPAADSLSTRGRFPSEASAL